MKSKQIIEAKPPVSIIVPVFNVENQLDRCVESLINQTFTDIEIILVDDGSTDSSPTICDNYCQRDSRVRVIHKTNEGLGLARNSGLDISQGHFVAFIDSDDYVKENMFEELYNKAIETRADAVISGGFITVKHNGDIRIDREIDCEIIYDGNTRQLALEMMGSLPKYKKDSVYEMSACKGIYRREILENNKIRFQSERTVISEDLVFHFDFFQSAKRVVIVPEVYYYYCEHLSSLTKKYQKDRFNRNVAFYQYMKTVLKKYEYEDKDYLYVDRMLIARSRVAISQIVMQYHRINRTVKQEILDICNSQVLKEVLMDYPIYMLPLKQRIFAWAMKKKEWITLYILTCLNMLKKGELRKCTE